MSAYTAWFNGHDLGERFVASPPERNLVTWEPDLVAMPSGYGSLFAGTKAQAMEITLRLTTFAETLEQRLMHYSDTDINAHVNNTRYADFACDAIRADLLPEDVFVAGMQLGYHAECRPGEVVDLMAARQEQNCFVHGIDETGKSRFDVQIFLGQDIP